MAESATPELLLASHPCGQCLTTKNRIVPGKRAAQIVRDCRQTGNHFICHKSAAGEIVHCRGVHDRFGSNAHRFAVAVGIPIRHIDMDARENSGTAKGNDA